jgi:hypothetical protein
MQDRDLIMQEVGEDAPTVSEVADKLADQDLKKESEETEQGSLVEAQDGTRRELTGPKTRALRGYLWRPALLLPSSPNLVLTTWRNTWKTLTGRPSASMGSASVDEVVREPRVAPTDHRQLLLPSKNVLPDARVVTGTTRFPIQTTDLTFPCLVSRGRLI